MQAQSAPFTLGGSPFMSNGGRMVGHQDAPTTGDSPAAPAPTITTPIHDNPAPQPDVAPARESRGGVVDGFERARGSSSAGGAGGAGQQVSESAGHQVPSRLTSHNLQRITAASASNKFLLKGGLRTQADIQA